MDERLQLNHRPLGYGAVNTFVDLAQLNPPFGLKKHFQLDPTLDPRKAPRNKGQATRIPRAPDGRWKKKHRAVLSISILAGKSRLRLPCPARLNTVKDKLINHMICTAHFGSTARM